jgi:hypothetical protein
MGKQAKDIAQEYNHVWFSVWLVNCGTNRKAIMKVYTYENEEWRFHRDGEVLRSAGVAVIFEQDDPFDVLLKHGPSDKIETLFLSDRYDQLARTGCRLVMITVPPRCCDTLNKCLSISASKWCSRLMDEANKCENDLITVECGGEPC